MMPRDDSESVAAEKTMKGLMMSYPLTLDRILEHAKRLHSGKKILTKMPSGALHEHTYSDLYRRVKRLCNALESLGIQPGDRVGTFAWNTFQHLELYYAIPCAGAVCHTLNIRLAPDQVSFIINHAEDKVVFIDASLLSQFERITEELPSVRHIVLLNADHEIRTRFKNVLHYEELIAAANEEYTWRCSEENAAMGLCYTSGTTGHPRAALYSHRSMFLHTLGSSLAAGFGIMESDVVLPVVPQFHAMAWGLPYACLLNGADLVMPSSHLQPAMLAQMIEEHRVTIAAGVPTIWAGLYQELKSRPRDISSLRSVIAGGAAMPRSLIEAFEKEFGINVVHSWGMTEMSPLGTCGRLTKKDETLTPNQRWDLKSKQGRPVPLVEMRIVDEAGQEQQWDGVTMGELQVRGPWVAQQYFKVEKSPEHFTNDGWFRTGDVATITPEGYLCITDRTKDLIKSGGEWISSVALECAIMAHPKVLEAAVVAVPDDNWGERPLAVVVLTPQANRLTKEELDPALLMQFPKFWLPDFVVIVDSIPKTTVGKFDKKKIRQLYATRES